GNLSVYRSNGGEALSVFSRLDFSGSPSGLKMADLDADGDLDLLVYNRSSSCQQVMLGDGEGGFQAGVCVDFSNVLALADVDTGGRPEVVSVANGNELQIHAIEEDFSFRFLRSVRVAGLGRIYRGAALDADGDEHIDLVVAGVFGDQSRVATLINNTQGVLINCNLSEPLAANPFLFADLDGDGGFDLISVAIEAQRTVYRVFWQEFPEQACGNGVLEEDERCDDGNTDDGDGCSAACISESDGVCTPERYDGTQMAALATTLWSCCGRGEHEYTPTTTSVTLPGDVPATALLLNQLESNYSSFNGWAGQRRWYEGHSIAVWAKPRNDGMACLLARFGPPSPGNPWHRQRATLCWDRRNQRISTWVQGREQHLQAANFGDAWVRLGFEADVANRRIQFFINGQRIQEHNYSQPGDDVSVALLSSTRDTGTTSTLFADLAIGLDRYEVCFPAPAENGGGG
ncbi:MAG: VCBS repeat-containing protein, partial [Myxococcota bacterium]|nr:VCBS repeat-containing protein [Myxococcota bacterium]